MKDRGQPLFLERESYKQRRTTDAARLLPILGFLALCLPLLWGGVRLTSAGAIYLFLVWALLIVIARVLARRLDKISIEQDDAD